MTDRVECGAGGCERTALLRALHERDHTIEHLVQANHALHDELAATRARVAELEAWGNSLLADAQGAWRRYHAVRAAADGLHEELERLVLSHHATLEEALQCYRCEDAVNELVDYASVGEGRGEITDIDDPGAQIRLVVDAARRFVQALDATEASIRPDPEGVIDGPHGQALRAAVAALGAAREEAHHDA